MSKNVICKMSFSFIVFPVFYKYDIYLSLPHISLFFHVEVIADQIEKSNVMVIRYFLIQKALKFVISPNVERALSFRRSLRLRQ